MKAYTLKKKRETEELHLFEGDFTNVKEKKCNSKQISICEKMDKNESEGNLFFCEDENIARTKCAQLGRKVCGICVSHLYATYD